VRRPVMAKIRETFKRMIGDYPHYEETANVGRYIRPSLAVPNPASASLLGMAELLRLEHLSPDTWRDAPVPPAAGSA
jgi:hypothetical protein